MKTIREIRKILFDTNIKIYINGILRTNKEGRTILFNQQNQDLIVTVGFIYNDISIEEKIILT